MHEYGYYSITFDFYTGNADNTLSFHINDKNTYDGDSNDMAFSKATNGESNSTHLNKNTWYKMRININLNTGGINSSAYNPVTGKTPSNGETYDTNGNKVIRHKLRYIVFRGRADAGTVASGGGPKIDNIMITYYGEGSNQKEYGNSFDGKDLRNVFEYNIKTGAANRLGSSDWDLHNRVGDGSNHMVAGGVNGSAYALSPVYAVGESVNATHSSEYWVDGGLHDPMGQWRIQHWFKIGSTNDNTERLDFNDNSTYHEASQQTIYTFTNSNINKGEWYHFDAVLDLDIHRKTIRVTDSKGNVVDEVNGTIDKDKLTYLSWYSSKGSNKVYTADDCFLIDDLGISYNKASVDDYLRVDNTTGFTFDDSANTVRFRSRVFNNLFIEDDANHKKYKSFLGVYDSDGNLVYFHPGDYRDCPTNDYWTTDSDGEDVHTVPYSALPGGSPSGLTFRKFIWGWDSTTGTDTGRAFGTTVEVSK